MTTPKHYTKDEFIGFWPGGFDCDSQAYYDSTIGLVRQYAEQQSKRPGSVAAEIGPGAGTYSPELTKRFTHTHFCDVVPAGPKFLSRVGANHTYHELPSQTYAMPVEPRSLDFVLSVNCFCHLPHSAIRQYLASIRQSLSGPDARALIALPNWPNYPSLAPYTKDKERYAESVSGHGWFYGDEETGFRLATEAGFQVANAHPGHRDLWLDLRL